MQRSGECGGQSAEVREREGPVLDGAAAAPSVVGSQQPWLWTASGVKAATPGVHANKPSPLKAVGSLCLSGFLCRTGHWGPCGHSRY